MVARRHCARERQQGSVLVAVMVFMALLMLFATTLINHLLVSEAEEVESLLAETRVYWAMNGHLNYMLSRAAAQGLCADETKNSELANNRVVACTNTDTGSPSDVDHNSFTNRTRDSLVGSLQDYLDGTGELQQNGSIDTPGELIWYFPQNANATNDGVTALNATNVANSANQYHFSIRGVVDKRNSSSIVVPPDGQMRIDLKVVNSATIPANDSAPVLRNIEDRVGRLTVGFCIIDEANQNGSPAPTTATSTCFSGPPTPTEGTSRIQFIQRNFPFSY